MTTLSCEQVRAWVPDLLAEALSPAQTEALQQHLQGCSACALEVESLRAVWQDLGTLPDEAPSEALREGFYARLRAERAAIEAGGGLNGRVRRLGAWLADLWPRQPAWQAALAAATLLVGLLVGWRGGSHAGDVSDLRAEVRSLSHLVTLSMLREDSPSERLQGVSYGRRLSGSDPRVMDALLDAAQHDPNVNVRLAAIDALAPQVGSAGVRDRLLAGFPEQGSPLVQIALVDAVTRAGGDDGRNALRPLLQERRLDPSVRIHLEKSLGIRG